ncbi:MAG: hypothetical protein HYY18_19455 [Planctomycetes bacterium]|nr:hypothetical protein [Planctomycetota bacterium]
MKTAWLAGALSLALAVSVAAAVVIDRSGKAAIVRIERDGKTVFEHRFATRQQIFAAEESPSGFYLFVWHMDRSPRRLTIFRLSDGAQIADFAPGFGGELRWTLGDKLLHAWGVGTNLAMIRVYDVTGAVLHSEGVTGYLLTGRGYYVGFPSIDIASDSSLYKYDVNTGKKTILRESLPGSPRKVELEEEILTLEFDSAEKLVVATDSH